MKNLSGLSDVMDKIDIINIILLYKNMTTQYTWQAEMYTVSKKYGYLLHVQVTLTILVQ